MSENPGNKDSYSKKIALLMVFASLLAIGLLYVRGESSLTVFSVTIPAAVACYAARLYFRRFDGPERKLEQVRAGRDVTESKPADNGLHDSEEPFRAMANSIPQLAWIAKADGYIHWYNRRWYEYTGTTPEQMAGWGWESVHRPEILPAVIERWQESLSTGKAFDMVFPLRGGDGNFRQFLTRVEPVKDGCGNVVQWFGTNTDITESRQMEEDLRRSELRFRLLSETASNLLTSENPQGLVNELCTGIMNHLDCHCFFNFLVDGNVGKLHLNACAGIPKEEVGKIQWLEYGQAVCGCVARDWERIIAEDIFNTPDIRTELVKSYGIQAYACHPLMVQGKLIGTLSFGTRTRRHFSPDDLSVMKTVTDQVAVAMERIRLIEGLRSSRDELELRVEERTAELKTFMARLEQSNQALQDFASIASHDLQEPLRKVISFGNMLKQRYNDSLGETGNDYLGRMLNATERMQTLLRGLLEYSRVTTQANPFVDVDLGKVVA
jgi:PAS domain S-box-containing protein